MILLCQWLLISFLHLIMHLLQCRFASVLDVLEEAQAVLHERWHVNLCLGDEDGLHSALQAPQPGWSAFAAAMTSTDGTCMTRDCLDPLDHSPQLQHYTRQDTWRSHVPPVKGVPGIILDSQFCGLHFGALIFCVRSLTAQVRTQPGERLSH